MQTTIISPIRRLLAFALLATFAIYEVHVILYTHIHYERGIWMKHCHPMNGAHHHTTNEFAFASDTTSFLPVITTLHDKPATLFTDYTPSWIIDRSSRLVQGVHLLTPSLRAPPACS